MRAFLRLWAMLLWLTATNPIYWALMILALYGMWRWRVPQWAGFWVFNSAAVVSLALSLFVDGGGGLHERIRYAQAGRMVLTAAVAAMATLALFWCALSSVLLQRMG